MGLILLVRLGQASYGTDDYDRLSGLGVLQSELLGAQLRQRWPAVSRVVPGTLKRQRDMCSSVSTAAEWHAPAEIDARWDEHSQFEESVEPFSSFRSRVSAALEERAARLGHGEVDVVFTSAGVVGWVAAALLGSGVPGWRALHNVVVNSSITRVAVGRRTRTLVSFNEHPHLARNLITYR